MSREKKSEATEGIKKSISETTRAISGNETLKIKFSADPSGDYGEVIKLPQISKDPTESEILKVRGTADSLALQARFKDEETFSKYDPSGEQAKEIYHELEIARCELLGEKYYPGSKKNIWQKTKVEASDYSNKSVLESEKEKISHLARYFIKRQLSELDLPSEASQLLDTKEIFTDLTSSPEFNKTEDIFDQEKFALLSRKLIERLGYGEQLGEIDDLDSDVEENNQEEVEQEDEAQGSDNEENDNSENSETDDGESQQQQSEANGRGGSECVLRSDSKDARRRVRRGHKDGERRMARSGGVDARGARRDALAEREFCDERKEFRISVWSGGRRGERVSEEENERAEERCGRGTRFERREGGIDSIEIERGVGGL